MMAPPKPLDPILYAKVKVEADRIYLTSSAYKSGWIVKTYKERGGKYTGNEKVPRLKRWFDEKWIDLTRKNKDGSYAPCGRQSASLKGTYPLCRPSLRVNDQSPKTPTELSRVAIVKAMRNKQQVKQTGRIRF
jgi:hypothetical protein